MERVGKVSWDLVGGGKYVGRIAMFQGWAILVREACLK